MRLHRSHHALASILLLLLLLPACSSDNTATTAAEPLADHVAVSADAESADAPAAEAAPTVVETTAPPASPAPETVPAPSDVQESPDVLTAPAAEKQATFCTISISCAAVNDNLSQLGAAKVDLVPQDGWILQPLSAEFFEGESVFNVLLRTCKEQKIHLEYKNTPLYNSAYIQGIGNLYEFDCGELSGWLYSVNGDFPNYGCSLYELNDGDVIEFIYTCDLGATEQNVPVNQ